MGHFLDPPTLLASGPVQFPRRIERLLWHLGATSVVNIDGPGDEGGDILAKLRGRDWVLQCKWKSRGPVGEEAVEEVARARDSYRVTRAAVVTNSRFSPAARRRAAELGRIGPPIALWDGGHLERAFSGLPDHFGQVRRRDYQDQAVARLKADLRSTGRGLLVLATGLGKTVVGGEVIGEYIQNNPKARVLVVAHAKDLVHQLERALWRHLPKSVETRLLTGDLKADKMDGLTCATVGSALSAAEFGYRPELVMVDEAHHLSADGQYEQLLRLLERSWQFGVTATPWRGDAYDITDRLGEPSFTLGIEEGMRRGYLAQVDYKLFVDDIDWDAVKAASTNSYGLSELNSKLFLPERDDAVRDELAAVWARTTRPRAIVFCRTIEHAERVARLLRQTPLWTGAEAVHNDLSKRDRQRRLLDFAAGRTPILTAVDILNEGVDVPDVNILCFARVTHSRRIFVQQLGRGLRLSEGKERVTVLDFVSDLRRIAAALNLKRSLEASGTLEVLANFSPSRIDFSDQLVEALMD
ncbi:DEAD/DEAH box helicase family protein, partial [Amycolatopsis lurida]|uniref:DEAD/DEAH box helicase family protein n=1 Tax=Amycolatopsis lurida TaxID=31959 RepID=UPI0036497B6A